MMKPGPTFDWNHVKWVGPTETVDPHEERCSYCGGGIAEEIVPLRMWLNEGEFIGYEVVQPGPMWSAVFCENCMAKHWGMEQVPALEIPWSDPDADPVADLRSEQLARDKK